jgi:hypothetical protein
MLHEIAVAAAVTVTLAAVRMPPASAYTIAVPTAPAVTAPFAETDAMRESDVVHSTWVVDGAPVESLAIPFSWSVEPGLSHALAGTTSSVSTEPSTGLVGSSSQAAATSTNANARARTRALSVEHLTQLRSLGLLLIYTL